MGGCGDKMVIALIISLIFIVILALRLGILLYKDIRLSNKLLYRNKEFLYLKDILEDSAVNKNSINQIFPAYLNKLKEDLGWSYHSIFRLDEDTQLLTIRYTGYLPDWYMKELSEKIFIKVGDASIGMAVATKQPATINTARIDPRFQSVTPIAVRTGYKSLSCYPLIGKLKTYGGMCTYSNQLNIFTLHDTQFFMTVANVLAIFLENRLMINAYLVEKPKV